jgi:predicted nucleic acid-binding protein
MQNVKMPLRVMADVVIDASAMVDLLLGNDLGEKVAARITGHELHGPTHLDSECLSALGRLHRSGDLSAAITEELISQLVKSPVTRHSLTDLIIGAWQRRDNLRLADALYVELSSQLNTPLITTDTRLHSIKLVEVIK